MSAAREFRQGLVIGGLLAGSVLLGLIHVHEGQLLQRIAEEDARGDSLTQANIVLERQNREHQLRIVVLAAIADEASARAAPVRAELQAVALRVEPRPEIAPAAAPAGDTTAYSVISRQGNPQTYQVPTFLLEDRALLLRSAFVLDSAWRAERTARLFLADTLAPDLRRQLLNSDSLVSSLRRSIALRDAQAKPRCAKKCGIALGVTGTILGAIALNEARAAIR